MGSVALAILFAVSAVSFCAAQETIAPQTVDQQSHGASLASPLIHAETDILLLPVVVRDGEGHVVKGLKKENFTVFDEGKPRAISRVTVEDNSITGKSDRATAPHEQAALNSLSAQQVVAPRRFVVFLFDDRHLSLAEFEMAKRAAIRMLDDPLPDSELVSVVTTSGLGSGMTADRSKLQSAIMRLTPKQRPRQDPHQCPYIDHYSADQIINQNSSTALSYAILNTIACAHASASVAEAMATAAAHQSLEAGNDDADASLEFVRNIVQTMSALRGERTLILVSPGFLAVADKARNLESQILDSAASASVAISTLDARGLYTTNLGANLSPTEAPLSSLVQHEHEFSDAAKNNQYVMAELAGGSGGTFFHNSNDLAGGLKRLTQPPEYLYVLDVSLQGIKPNGTYHSLKVKVDQKGYKLQSRAGYFVPSKAKSKK